MINTNEALLNEPIECYALKDIDDNWLNDSASGGAFTVFARQMLKQNGIVFGSAFKPDCKVEHIDVANEENLRLLQGSKYVYSRLGNSYSKCCELLRAGNMVLFSGTPCQVYGLRKYLTKHDCSEENLLCIDIICHGTPQPELYELYLEWLANKNKADNGILGYSFRNKYFGWGLYYYYYYLRRGKKHEVYGHADDDPYYREFLKGTTYRDCCYKCAFAQKGRVGDITIGDYWGIESEHPDFYDSQGVSAVLINTEKGKQFFEKYCSETCVYMPSSFEKISAHNVNLIRPTSRSDSSERLSIEIRDAVKQRDYSKIFDVMLYEKPSIKVCVRRIIPRPILGAIYQLRRR